MAENNAPSSTPHTPPGRGRPGKALIELIGAVATVLALFVALVAWLFPRSPSGPVAATPAPPPAPATTSQVPDAGSDPPSSTPSPTSASAEPSPTSPVPEPVDSTVAYARQELAISCGGIPIDLDEPRVLAQAGVDITYHCIDRAFSVSRDLVGGYVDAAAPRTRTTCQEAIRSAAFNQKTRDVVQGLVFCIETPDAAGTPGKLVHVEIVDPGYTTPVIMAVTAWHR